MKLALIVFSSLLFTCISYAQEILPGANQLDGYLPLLKGKAVAIFANQTSVVGKAHLVDTLLKRGVNIKKIFAPEHGFRGTADAGEHVNNLTDPETGIPIISLYGNKNKPSAEDLKDVDIMIFDIQDVGVRFYTYISSLQKYMESAVANGKPLIVLDRPNPNGFYVDGPVLDTAFKSFVGLQPVPVVYGMTIGEYAAMLAGEQMVPGFPKDYKKISSHLYLLIVPNLHYTHKSKYILPVKPSPNLPNMQSIYLYPSICFFEGTAISLGRGTDKPFQQFGHPSFPKKDYSFIPRSIEGARNPPLMNQLCYGYDLSNFNSAAIKGHIQLTWLLKAYHLFADKSKFFLPSNYFNTLAGSSILAQQIRDGKTESAIRKSWQPGINKFKKIRKKYLLYPDFE